MRRDEERCGKIGDRVFGNNGVERNSGGEIERNKERLGNLYMDL